MPSDTGEQLSVSNNKLNKIVEKLKPIYDRLSPEKQLVFGIISTYIFLSILINPEKMPDQVQPLLEILDKLPLNTISIWIATSAALIGSLDGVRRLIVEQFPFYKAYIHAFFLSNFDSNEE